MSTALVLTSKEVRHRGEQAPPVPWRDPHTVSSTDLVEYISQLETACLHNPQSADLRTCLGMAYAVNYDIDKSMEALEMATSVDPTHFWAQLKYAELHYRLRILRTAETETQKAVDLAQNAWQLGVAREQLQNIRRLNRESGRNIDWNPRLTKPSLVVSALVLVVLVLMFLQ
jgi:tetratricopeptide (TPR) repeat protein